MHELTGDHAWAAQRRLSYTILLEPADKGLSTSSAGIGGLSGRMKISPITPALRLRRSDPRPGGTPGLPSREPPVQVIAEPNQWLSIVSLDAWRPPTIVSVRAPPTSRKR
ncbi:hypothetical protein GCM10020216_071670 [Nonomuraea helvata]